MLLRHAPASSFRRDNAGICFADTNPFGLQTFSWLDNVRSGRSESLQTVETAMAMLKRNRVTRRWSDEVRLARH